MESRDKECVYQQRIVFDEESMLQEKSEMEDKVHGRAPNSSADTQEKRVEFSKNPKRPDRSVEDSSDLDENEQEATQDQPRRLRWLVRVMVPPVKYG